MGYEAGRPQYPESVYEVLERRCGLRRGARTLEVGPGTGLVTNRLLAAGPSVVAVEPDPGLARHLQVTLAGDLRVIGTTFEEAQVETGAFDLAVAATSFHWVDQGVGVVKLGRALSPGGWVALWWTLFRDPRAPDEFSRALDDLLGPSTGGAFDEPGRPPFQLDEEHRLRDLRTLAGLVEVGAQFFRTRCVMSSEQVRALCGSMATVLRRSPAEQDELLDAIEHLTLHDFGGQVERHFPTALYTGMRPMSSRF